jgi:tetratricopeptide (TPR) repeat protein
MSKNQKKKFQTSLPKKNQPAVLPAISSPLNGNHWLPAFCVLAITFLCFTSTLNNEFVNWDDDRNFYENPLVQTIDENNFWLNTKAIFQSQVIGNYNPLTIWTFALEKYFFGLENPLPWHLNNVILHLIAVLLVFRISLFLGIGWKGSTLTALLFGIHPMRVESVAWVTERKDVLFGVFYLGALLQYIKYKSDQKNIRWAFMTILFVLSLFSKIQAVSLPLSMMAVDYLKDEKWGFKSLLSKIPFLLLSIGFGLYGVIKLREFGSISDVSLTQFSFFQRLCIGAFSFIIYNIKLLVPFRMSALYPYPSQMPWYIYPSLLVAPVVLLYLKYTYQKNFKYLFFGMVFFIVNIIFLLQILGAGQGYLADRFTYIAYLGFFIIVGYYFDKSLGVFPQQTPLIQGGTLIYLIVIAFITFKQNNVWDNSATLWTHVLKYYDNVTTPYGNRANYYRDNKMYNEALADYNKTLSLDDNQPQAYNSRARLFFDLANGRDTLLMALNDYNKAIELDSTDGEFRVNRGATYARLGDLNNALKDLDNGIRLKPDHAVGFLNRSIMLQSTGNLKGALQDIESYLTLKPFDANMWYEKGRILTIIAQSENGVSANASRQAALASFSEALSFESPNRGMFFYERSKVYASLQMMPEAKNDLQQAISLGFQGVEPMYRSSLGL